MIGPHPGRRTARQASAGIRRTIAERGYARIVAATAASQLEFLDTLTKAPGIDWSRWKPFILTNTSACRSAIRGASVKCCWSS